MPKLPVVRVSFDEAKAYCAWLSRQTGRAFRLPTECEWEEAARAGAPGDTPWNGDKARCGRLANLADRSLAFGNAGQGFNYHLRDPEVDDGVRFLHDVDHMQEANGHGLRAMIGNVEEWTVGAVYFALLAIVLTTPVFLALVLALLAALYALTQRWLASRGVRRFESIR